jgi:hypothetical protein
MLAHSALPLEYCLLVNLGLKDEKNSIRGRARCEGEKNTDYKTKEQTTFMA